MKRIDHNQLEKLIKTAYATKIPLFVHGGVGIGKSDSVKKVAQDIAKENKLEFIDRMEQDGKFCFVDIRISQLDATDLRGIPTIDGNTTKWLIPNWLPQNAESKGILFFDELNLSPPSIQNACLQLILDRKLGDYALPAGWVIISAGNRIEDKANIFDIPFPLANRLTHIELAEPDVDSWVEWAIKHDIDTRVITFLKFKPQFLYDYNEKSKESALPTPRSWSFVSQLIKGVENEQELEINIASCVGEAISIEMAAYLRLRSKINVDLILTNPDKALLPQEIDLKFSLISAIVEKFKKNRKLILPILKISNRIEPEFTILLLKLIREIDQNALRKNVETKEFKGIVSSYGKYLA
jgi:MoxR-like ATPase